jgi:spermidine synthase
MPGETAYFIASPERGAITYDYRTLMDRAIRRALDLKYVREYYLFSRLSAEKIDYMIRALKSDHTSKANRDLKPASFFYYNIFWATQFRGSFFEKALKYVSEPAVVLVSVAVCLIAVFFTLKRPALTAVAVTGFSVMSLEIVMLLTFQFMYGYLFYRIGAIMSAFMAGLALGGWFVIRVMQDSNVAKVLFARAQAGVCACALALPVIFKALSHADSDISIFCSGAVFVALPAAIGFLGGIQFPLAGALISGKNAALGRISGAVYGVDLLGSSIGAAITGAVLIPIVGVFGTCIMLSSLNLVVFISLKRSP